MAYINNSLGSDSGGGSVLQDLQSVLTVGNLSDLSINLVSDYNNPGPDGALFAANGAAITSGNYQGVITPQGVFSFNGSLETSINPDTGLVLLNGGDQAIYIQNTVSETSYNLLTPNIGVNSDYYIPLSVNGTFADITGNITLPDPTPYIPTLQEVCTEGNDYILDNLQTTIGAGQIAIIDNSTSESIAINPNLIRFQKPGSSLLNLEFAGGTFGLKTQVLQDAAGTIALLSDIPSLTGYQLISQKNNANGYAGLDGSGKIFTSQLPSITVTEVYTVASQVAQLALIADEGDVAIRTDLSKSYIHNGGTAGTMADWSELLTPTGGVTSVTGTTNRITSTGGTSPVIDISSAYVGQTSITTLGTITTGTWQATVIDDTYISSATTWNAKQAALVSGTNIKTVNGTTLLGSGNLAVGDALLSATQTFTGINTFISKVSALGGLDIPNNDTNGRYFGIGGSTTGALFSAGYSAGFQAFGTATAATSGVKRAFSAEYTFSPTSGTATMTAFSYTGTINQTGGANGIIRGLHVNPTITAAADFRAIEAFTGAIVLPYRAVTTTSTLANTDHFVTTTGTITITLPTSVAGKIVKVKNIGSGTITINPASGTIDGAGSKSLTVQYTGFEFTGDGTNWLITGTF